ncbi:MAG: hypothetical protein WD509_02355 [Candidatus Paceibacterota bacterium]
MEDFNQALPKDLHHAYVVDGGVGATDTLLRYLEELGITILGNPDVYVREYSVFGIDDGRAIQALENKKAFVGDKKFFIITAQGITREAQNALLKTFEEPKDGTHFFLLVPSAGVLLETLLSRVQVISLQGGASGDSSLSSLFAKQFLTATPAERIALISEIVEAKDKAEALSLVNGLETALYERSSLGKHIGGDDSIPTEAFESLQSVRSYLDDRSASVKILLEHLATTLPRIASKIS